MMHSMTIKNTVFLTWRIGCPPIPHEHGAWVMLYVPLLITAAAVPPVAVVPSVLLLLAVTSAFLGQHAARLVIRRRGHEGTRLWLGMYLTLLAASIVPLLFIYHRTALLFVGLLASVLFGLHTLLVCWPSRKRLDRSQWGETLAVGALTLTAPAAYVVSRGTLDRTVWSIWAACVLYFSSGVFYVNMLLSAAKVRGHLDARARWATGRDLVLYHAALTVIAATAIATTRGWAVLLAALAYGPVIVRALWGWATLSNVLPPLTRVGWREVLYTLWFMGFFFATLRYTLS